MFHSSYHSYTGMSSYNFSRSSKPYSLRTKSKFDYHTITTPVTLPKKYERDLIVDTYSFDYKYKMNSIKKFEEETTKNCIPAKKQKTCDDNSSLGLDNLSIHGEEKEADRGEEKESEKATKTSLPSTKQDEKEASLVKMSENKETVDKEKLKSMDVDAPHGGYPTGYSRCLIEDERQESSAKNGVEMKEKKCHDETSVIEEKEKEGDKNKVHNVPSLKAEGKPALSISKKYLIGASSEAGDRVEKSASDQGKFADVTEKSEEDKHDQQDKQDKQDQRELQKPEHCQEECSSNEKASSNEKDDKHTSVCQDTADDKHTSVCQDSADDKHTSVCQDTADEITDQISQKSEQMNENDDELNEDEPKELTQTDEDKREEKQNENSIINAENEFDNKLLPDSTCSNQEEHAGTTEKIKNVETSNQVPVKKRKKDAENPTLSAQNTEEANKKTSKKQEKCKTSGNKLEALKTKKRNSNIPLKYSKKLRTIVEAVQEGVDDTLKLQTKEEINDQTLSSDCTSDGKEKVDIDANDIQSDTTDEQVTLSEQKNKMKEEEVMDINENIESSETSSDTKQTSDSAPEGEGEEKHTENSASTKSSVAKEKLTRSKSACSSKEKCPCSRNEKLTITDVTSSADEGTHPRRNGSHVRCTNCSQWYHTKCINLSKSEGRKLKEHKITYTCIFCLAKKLKHIDWIKDTLFHIIANNNNNNNSNNSSNNNSNDNNDNSVTNGDDNDNDNKTNTNQGVLPTLGDGEEQSTKEEEEKENETTPAEEDYHNQILDKLISNLSSSNNLTPLRAKNIRASTIKENFIWDEFY